MSNQLTGSTGPLYARDISGGFGNQIRGTLIFPATVNVADPAGLTDNLSAMLSVDASGRLRIVLSGPAPAGTVSVQPAILADDTAVRTTTAAPAANAVLATLTPAAGTYEITATVYFTVAGTVNNAEFREGAAVVSQLQLPAVVSQIPLVHKFYRVLDGATTITINATAADAVGTYSAMLTAHRVA
jgi:hypothetical protein